MLDKYYSFQPVEKHRDESVEIVDRLMSETIEIIHEHGREKLTIYECVHRLYTEQRDIAENAKEEISAKELNSYRLAIGRYGIRLYEKDKVAIQNRHHMIKKITSLADGYSHTLRRHPGLIDSSRVVCFPDGKNQRCTILGGLIEKEWGEKSDDEKLEDIIVG